MSCSDSPKWAANAVRTAGVDILDESSGKRKIGGLTARRSLQNRAAIGGTLDKPIEYLPW